MSGIIRSRRREAVASRRGRCTVRRGAAAALAVLGGPWAPAASAEVLLFTVNPATVGFTEQPIFFDLNGPGGGRGHAAHVRHDPGEAARRHHLQRLLRGHLPTRWDRP
jgi:hypothetical protein